MDEQYQLYLGDALAILPTLEAESIDAIITDLPYGTTACAWDTVIPFEPLWAAVKCVLKPRGVFVTTASQPFTSALIMSNVQWFRCEWIWHKTIAANYGNLKYHPAKHHESIIVFSRQMHKYNPQMERSKAYIDGFRRRKTRGDDIYQSASFSMKKAIKNDGTRYPSSVQYFPNGNSGVVHPTQKPIDLYEYLILTYSDLGDLILDPFIGSGTTGVACLQLGRRFIGVEICEDYFKVAQKRLAQAARQMLLPLEIG